MAPFDGIVVIERAGRLAAAVGATLLAELGATVLRVEDPSLPMPDEPEHWQHHPLALAGKTRIRLSGDRDTAARQWADMLARADAVIYSPPLPGDQFGRPGLVRCDVSAFGAAGAEGLPDTANEAILQAIGGIMSTTGTKDGPPELTGAPLVELFTGVNCAVSVAAALRVRDAGGPAQRIDLSAFDSGVALSGAFIGHMQAGTAHDVRAGSRHPLCCPWNAYATTDGWVLMCSSTEPHWQRIAELIGRPDLKDHPDFADTNARKRNEDAVDAAITAWTETRTTDEAVDGFDAAGIPVGPILSIPDLLGREDAPPTRKIAGPDGKATRCPMPLIDLGRTPCRTADTIAKTETVDAATSALSPRTFATPEGNGRLPLSGIRVIEVGVFTAGPLGARYLADLGAEVIKIEQAGGETGRKWAPNFGGVSGYFASYNAGKRSLTLDLTQSEDQAVLEELVGSADVLLQNLKAGAMARMGFGPEEVMQRYPRLIYVSVSGYGSKGSKSPALDTVIQARSGLMSLIEAPDVPVKSGASVGDLLASHITPLGVLAALRDRDRSGLGQHVDVSMRDALAWTTQLSWPDGAPSLPVSTRLACSDGWVIAQGPGSAVAKALDGVSAETQRCQDIVDRLRDAGLAASRVLELDDLYRLPLCAERVLFRQADTPGGVPAPILSAPYGLSATPAVPGPAIPAAGEANGKLAAVTSG